MTKFTTDIHDPDNKLRSNDLAVRRGAVQDSIAAKQAQMPRVDHNGYPIADEDPQIVEHGPQDAA